MYLGIQGCIYLQLNPVGAQGIRRHNKYEPLPTTQSLIYPPDEVIMVDLRRVHPDIRTGSTKVCNQPACKFIVSVAMAHEHLDWLCHRTDPFPQKVPATSIRYLENQGNRVCGLWSHPSQALAGGATD